MSPRFKAIMSAIVSVLVLVAGLIVILWGGGDGYPQQSREWAFGIVGLVVGYWLR